MGISKTERTAFIDQLIQKGWSWKNGTLWSPSRGLWFSESHFSHWTLENFSDIFAQRAKKIRSFPGKNLLQAAKENQDVSDVAGSLLGNII